MQTLLKQYKVRLKQLNNGYPELYKGEKETIRELVKKLKG